LRSGGEIITMGLKDEDFTLMQQGWRIVEKNQGKIYDLVMDMLSYSKEREPAIEDTDLNAVVHDVVELMAGRAATLEIELKTELDSLPLCQADREGIHRALLNIVGNALDAVESADRPSVRIQTSVERGGGWAVIAVTDNGSGISPHKMNDLFRPFVSSKGTRGTGLGLAVSRKIMREHGGDILVTSQEGQGSTFILKLPLRKAAPGSDPGGTMLRSPALPPPE
jgi:signal transduction histidine kinase